MRKLRDKINKANEITRYNTAFNLYIIINNISI